MHEGPNGTGRHLTRMGTSSLLEGDVGAALAELEELPRATRAAMLWPSDEAAATA